ncbi:MULTISPECIES: EI24 domain-containing protein [unclassified Streptomyces]|uniref:EI24 domain-containing protein n=1 Tax=unclassified Streptomyces TaxID=2593676 RepID=UPI00225006BD|nr:MULTISPECIES: EI24 domain-containing protein [unclassified Streptomyces]MCX4991166.1 EI24 domain-containing protein [Streptomyces sp. NBC_00568]MCX5003597.1 EI24 domain-containing protein [Streptomyces sp. NBC_00638]
MRDLGVGFGYLLRGQRWVARHGKSYGFGLLPGLITLVLYAAALVALGVYGEDFVTWATPFADDWTSPWSGLFRGFLTAVLFALALLLSVLTFTAVTLLVGQPFYESLSERVDRDVSPDGTAPESGLPLWRELWISGRDSLRILVRALVWAILLFALGFVPFIGQTVVPVLGFVVTGFFLTEELVAVAMQRRRVDLRERLALLRSRKTLVWGFGTPLGLAFLVPFVAVFLMPGAVAGATLMARDLLGEEIGEGAGDDPGTAADGDPETLAEGERATP